jgi:GcrA cell cycle regulator
LSSPLCHRSVNSASPPEPGLDEVCATVRRPQGGGAQPYWTAERTAELIRRRAAGQNRQELLAAFTCSYWTLDNQISKLRRAGLLPPERLPPVPIAATEWPPERIAAARALWDEGLSTPQIGRRLGCSKNAVVSIARRARPKFTERQSPIIRGGPQTPASARQAARRAGGPSPARERSTLPALASSPSPDTSRPMQQLRQPPPYVPPHLGPVTACCWPIGEPRTPGFRFCEAPTRPGKPYCHEHYRMAYVPVPRDRREAAA